MIQGCAETHPSIWGPLCALGHLELLHIKAYKQEGVSEEQGYWAFSASEVAAPFFRASPNWKRKKKPKSVKRLFFGFMKKEKPIKMALLLLDGSDCQPKSDF